MALGLFAALQAASAQLAPITSFSPPRGPVGTVVTVKGSNFSKIQKLYFWPTPATFTVVDDSTLTTVVPVGAKTCPIMTETASGKSGSSLGFIVDTSSGTGGGGNAAAPTISSFGASPTMATAGKPVLLTWNVTGATSLSVGGVGTVGGNSILVAPTQTTSYTLIATNAGGTTSSTITVVVQPAASANLFPASSIVRAAGANRTIKVRAKGPWTATSNAPWIGIVSGASGQDDGVVTFAVDSNPGAAPRTGTVQIAGQTYTVYEDGQTALVHPRLWFNPSDIAKMRTWAVPQNPTYVILGDIVAQAKQAYDTRFGTSNWNDTGIWTFSPETTEDYAVLFAFMSQLETDPVKSSDYAMRAKNMMMYVINQAALGPADNVPFRDPHFPIKDRARISGQTFPLIVDYIYPYLTAADKATIESVFLQWNAASKGAYVGLASPLAMGLRASANNFQISHFRNVIMRSEVMDPADDPGGALHGTTAYATGRWLTDLWTLFDHGDASGGLPVEGTLYSTCFGWFHDALWTMRKTGLDDPSSGSPQNGMIDSLYWDRWTTAFLHQLANTTYVPASSPWVGNVFEQLGYGDQLRAWAIPENLWQLGTLILSDRASGNDARADAEFWIVRNALQDSPVWLNRVPGRSWFGNPAGSDATLQFAVRDPFLAPPADPRPSLPTTFESTMPAMTISRTGWDAAATTVSFRSAYITENHTTGDAGSFQLHRKGEMLTSAVRAYSGKNILNDSEYANTLTIQNDVPSDLNWFEDEISKRGGQWILGVATGDPKLVTSSGPGYLAADTNITKTYNRITYRSAVTDVKLATRTMIWLQPDWLVIYDRATTGKAGRFKRFNLQLPSQAIVNGNVATSATAKGQRLFLTSLLPAGGTITAKAQETDGKAEGESMNARLSVEDPNAPADVRFLNVIQGADSNGVRTPATLISSGSGTPFEGITLANFAVLFPHDLVTASFAGTTYCVPTAVDTHFLAGLTPGGSYNVTIVPVATGYKVSVTPGLGFVADKAGVLTFTKSQVAP